MTPTTRYCTVTPAGRSSDNNSSTTFTIRRLGQRLDHAVVDAQHLGGGGRRQGQGLALRVPAGLLELTVGGGAGMGMAGLV